jgi:uncharacterized protein YukE
MAGQITQKIKLDFASSGLDAIEKTLKEAVPFLNKKKSSETVARLQNQLEALRSVYNKNQGEFAENSADSFLQEYKKVIKEVGNLTSQLNFAPSAELDRKRVAAEEAANRLEQQIIEYKRQLDSSRKSVRVDESGRTVSGAFKQRAFTDIIKDPATSGLSDLTRSSRGQETGQYTT